MKEGRKEHPTSRQQYQRGVFYKGVGYTRAQREIGTLIALVSNLIL